MAVAAARPTTVVYHLCIPPPGRLPRWLRAVLARVDTTVSVSEHTLGLWRDTGLRIDRAVVALTSVDLETYVPGRPAGWEQTRNELGIGHEDRMILFGGRIASEKGGRRPRSGLPAGGGEGGSVPPRRARFARCQRRPVESARYVEELHALSEGLPVTWLPRRDNVVSLLQTADVASVPSVWPEPLSRSIMEALACGVRVVATAVGGSPEILTGWMSSLLANPGYADDLARHLLDVLDWRDRNSDLGPACRRAAEERLSLNDEVDLIEGAMLSALDRRRA